MSTETEHTTEFEKNDEEHGHEHPSDKKYFQIAGVLAILTALEVGTYWLESMPGEILIPLLMIMMVIKFFYVAAWFMHLRFDNSLFMKFFVSGLVLASIVYAIFLTVFEFWHKG
ncbi:MAG: hypothetical protein CL430_02210 [Acidimicrobiaceae bacterium]|mgnify:FL=1|jgi:caa(3)-type oxidase subunit IV|nr:hypothetical protein [Acidimicrobiaceae bacterium]MDP6285441.1 cytochrome C oxidase subunit IV family protein [Acidimicrobiales bacterium]MDP6894872.1 cytochrome C oxidase subunit IV family protein [Acidimicrobiales bacterium]|tara:strand:- start:700 stop:1041 length:342 start_codon:yes stop_codon:yes gene_type:complete